MTKQKPEAKQQLNRVVPPIHAYSDDSFVRLMSGMIGLDPKAEQGKKK
ncbi:hypothetical protein [Pseudomonas aeruginosa]|nr:hypothetical protein [Pseudomonas aeruginosa]